MVWSGMLGFLIGSVTVTLLQALLPAGAMESYGWRIPFLLAGPLGASSVSTSGCAWPTPHSSRS